MVRDREIERLIKYAEGMGLKVKFKPYVKRSYTSAEWSLDGSEIVIYMSSGDSKLSHILSLIHELGHHKDFIQDGRKISAQLDRVYGKREEELNKEDRKKILDSELAGMEYWVEIYKDTDCKFNIDKLYKQREYDAWMYTNYYENGKFPTSYEIGDKKTELRKKYGC